MLPSEVFCSWCRTTKPAEEFAKHTRSWTGRQSRCKECWSAISRDRRFNLESGWYERTLAAQGGGCAICGSKQKRMCVDHDHSCCPEPRNCCGKCVRGLLCHGCNTGLSYFRDDPELLEATIAYLGGA